MNNPLFLDCEQLSKAWFDARLGCVTSSRIADVVKKRQKSSNGKSKEEPLQCRVDMTWELVIELLTGRPTEHYVSRWMKEGKVKEPFARSEYGVLTDAFVEQIGFAYHPSIKLAGASPDGIIEAERGLLEIKCPKLETHLGYIADNKIPDDYLPQMVWQLGCCPDYDWNDFVSYYCPMPEDDPRFAVTLDPKLTIFRKRLQRTAEVDALIRGYEAEVGTFNQEVQDVLGTLRERIAQGVAA